jgi:hypothetical protein
MTNKKIFTALLSVLLLITLGGCDVRNIAADPTPEPVEYTEPVSQPEPAESSEAELVFGRQDGERFENIIILEGMEETVRYEHVRNDAIGFEMDYDYENFERRSEADRECFVSRWDDTSHPENYLEVKYSPLDAAGAAASIGAALSNDYEISRDDSFMLDRAGSCIHIDASANKGGLTMPDQLQTVYIIPAADGCRIATAHYSIEGAEGFGRRFRYIMNTFSAIESQGVRSLTNEQAISAIRQYCCVMNPDLENYVNAGDAPVYWDIASSDGNEIVVVFRSYTGALNRYYINPVSGDAYVTEQVPGIIDEEQRTGETLNVWNYLY